MKTELVHISQIKHGDVIKFQNQFRTVNKKDIDYSNFMGISIWGDTFKLGRVLIERMVTKQYKLKN